MEPNDPRLATIKAEFDLLLEHVATLRREGIHVQLKGCGGGTFDLTPEHWSLVAVVHL